MVTEGRRGSGRRLGTVATQYTDTALLRLFRCYPPRSAHTALHCDALRCAARCMHGRSHWTGIYNGRHCSPMFGPRAAMVECGMSVHMSIDMPMHMSTRMPIVSPCECVCKCLHASIHACLHTSLFTHLFLRGRPPWSPNLQHANRHRSHRQSIISRCASTCVLTCMRTGIEPLNIVDRS